MAIDTVTVRLLESVLSPAGSRNVFSTIASQRIADKKSLLLLINDNELKPVLDRLVKADLIGAGRDVQPEENKKYYVTAKGLKVARDLEKLSLANGNG